ncbi:hypothetical protein BJL96_38710 [Burkholderia cenocepacia]|nr:hypothetical protein A3203_14700 [Burkholderia cenocepacia]AOK64582.1 hypothetical protein WM33_02905 [Burkholderia multivorans]KVZ77680.1 hypothetical protein WL23_19685 [Burkholderia multivorans]NGO93537.1 hypothetical protein [Burkholderia cenocepacia]ODN63875.1 hypothetical protein BA763_22045 [Burkholderia cenocepacia]
MTLRQGSRVRLLRQSMLVSSVSACDHFSAVPEIPLGLTDFQFHLGLNLPPVALVTLRARSDVVTQWDSASLQK